MASTQQDNMSFVTQNLGNLQLEQSREITNLQQPVFTAPFTADMTPGYMQTLLGLCKPEEDMLRAGYVLKPLTAEQLNRKIKCRYCLSGEQASLS